MLCDCYLARETGNAPALRMVDANRILRILSFKMQIGIGRLKPACLLYYSPVRISGENAPFPPRSCGDRIWGRVGERGSPVLRARQTVFLPPPSPGFNSLGACCPQDPCCSIKSKNELINNLMWMFHCAGVALFSLHCFGKFSLMQTVYFQCGTKSVLCPGGEGFFKIECRLSDFQKSRLADDRTRKTSHSFSSSCRPSLGTPGHAFCWWLLATYY